MVEAGLDLTKMSGAGSPSAFSPQGLAAAEAAARLLAEGPNELPGRHRRTALHIFLEVLREPMFALLLAAAGDPRRHTSGPAGAPALWLRAIVRG